MPDPERHLDMTVGCREVDVTDAVQGARVPLRLLYPARMPERTEHFGPYPLRVAVDAPAAGLRFRSLSRVDPIAVLAAVLMCHRRAWGTK